MDSPVRDYRFCWAFTMKSISFFFLAASVWLVAGCDLGTYSSRYNDRVGKMTSMANTNKDLANELIDIKGVAKIRVPTVCNNPNSVRYGERDDFLKARIPGIEIDGFVTSFMGDKLAGDGKWYPFQVYLYYLPGKNVEDTKSEIRSAVNVVLKQTRVTWDSMSVEAYDGTPYSWASTTIGAGQEFLVFENGLENKVELNGRLDFYATSNPEGTLVVAFRAPSSVFADEDRPLIEGTLKSIQGFK